MTIATRHGSNAFPERAVSCFVYRCLPSFSIHPPMFSLGGRYGLLRYSNGRNEDRRSSRLGAVPSIVSSKVHRVRLFSPSLRFVFIPLLASKSKAADHCYFILSLSLPHLYRSTQRAITGSTHSIVSWAVEVKCCINNPWELDIADRPPSSHFF